MEDVILPGEQFIEDAWNAQRGCDPVTGAAWLTPRMERNSAALQRAHLEQENAGLRADVQNLRAELQRVKDRIAEARRILS